MGFNERDVLGEAIDQMLPATKFFNNDLGSHFGRAIIRVMLEPERFAPVDMVAVYDDELVRRPKPLKDEERQFFAEFVTKYGVLETRQDENSAA